MQNTSKGANIYMNKETYEMLINYKTNKETKVEMIK
jgi:hypothetical protein